MKHYSPLEMRSADPIETRDDDPLAAATRAVDELRSSVAQFRTDVDKKFDDRFSAIDTRAKEITDRLDALDLRAGRPGTTKHADQVSAEMRAFDSYLRSMKSPEEIRTLQVGSDPQGGYIAPPEFTLEFVRNLVEVSPVRAWASVKKTSAPSVTMPKRTSVTNALWKGELQASEESEPAFGQIEIAANELKTHTDVSNQLVQDSAADLFAEVSQGLAEDFSAKEGTAFWSGNGVGRPEGVTVSSQVSYVANGSTTVFAVDSLISLMYAVPATYRNSKSAAFAMSSTSLAALRKAKTGDDAYIWQPSLQVGQPETILGKPVFECVDADDITTANGFPIVFGDWSGYRIVDRVDMSVMANPFLLATEGLTRYHATRRVGGQVIQGAKFRKLKMSVS